ncbi:MAG: YciI family protein [Acidimicrobiia bacterium]|nr:YciI family protein [Acidimicrobiia bacterium]
MPQYLLSVMHDDEYDTDIDVEDPDVQRLHAQVGAVNEELAAAGAWVFGAGLMPASSATVVRSIDGDVSMTDGPYAETKEQMGGFWIIEVSDLDAALTWAGKCAAACEGPVEVRPMQGG